MTIDTTTGTQTGMTTDRRWTFCRDCRSWRGWSGKREKVLAHPEGPCFERPPGAQRPERVDGAFGCERGTPRRKDGRA